MKKFILRSFWIFSIIIVIIVSIYINLQAYETHEYDNPNYILISTNYILMGIIELVNLVFGFYILFRKNEKYILLSSLYLIFLVVTFFIPIYHNGKTYTIDSPDSYLMGLAYEERYQNIYGITISKTR